MVKQMDKIEKKKYITFTKKQIISISKHRNNLIDTKTNEVMNMYTIKLPSRNYRHTQFEQDSQGVDRNSRTATISIGEPYVKQNKENTELFYTYPNPNKEYTIYFKGRIVGKDGTKNIFDKPEPLKVTGQELIDIFDEAIQISKEKKSTLKKQKDQTENEPKKTEVKKEINKNEVSR